ncbi:MAG: hypothetical protein A4S09_14215 [Proteobacteria bacterium SG_bin7]|nr:MAG: hypothetical protein A4S09_14215 [Proteobacteria bacterium SG_bin7]
MNMSLVIFFAVYIAMAFQKTSAASCAVRASIVFVVFQVTTSLGSSPAAASKCRTLFSSQSTVLTLVENFDRENEGSQMRQVLNERFKNLSGSKFRFEEAVKESVLKLSSEQKEAIRRFSERYAYFVNSILRGEMTLESQSDLQRERVLLVMRYLPEAMQHLVEFKGVVVRGGKLPSRAERDSGSVSGLSFSIVKSPAFLSATTDLGNAFDWYGQGTNGPNDILVIHSKSGRALPSELQVNSGEQEILFAPNTRFRVLHSKKLKRGRTLYELEEI